MRARRVVHWLPLDSISASRWLDDVCCGAGGGGPSPIFAHAPAHPTRAHAQPPRHRNRPAPRRHTRTHAWRGNHPEPIMLPRGERWFGVVGLFARDADVVAQPSCRVVERRSPCGEIFVTWRVISIRHGDHHAVILPLRGVVRAVWRACLGDERPLLAMLAFSPVIHAPCSPI